MFERFVREYKRKREVKRFFRDLKKNSRRNTELHTQHLQQIAKEREGKTHYVELGGKKYEVISYRGATGWTGDPGATVLESTAGDDKGKKYEGTAHFVNGMFVDEGKHSYE